MTEQRPVPASRKQLWAILFEAAEIEHNLMSSCVRAPDARSIG
ncbi:MULTISPECIES: hypothetical protein [Sphingomonas]|nr:hypothetical protein [Sphingomonas sp. CCH10-B3]